MTEERHAERVAARSGKDTAAVVMSFGVVFVKNPG
jgi:hypothetical protein